MFKATYNVHVIPLGLDYDRIVRGIAAYGADKIYVLRGKPHPVESAVDPYFMKLKQHYATLVDDKKFKEIRVDIFNLAEVCSRIYHIMEQEKANRLYFCLSSSTKLLSAFMLFAAWSKGEELKHKPTIYYVNPARYVHIEFTQLAERADELVSKVGTSSSPADVRQIKAFLIQVRNTATAAKEGLTLGAEGKGRPIEVPFIPVKKPSKTGIEILKLLYKNRGRFESIDRLAKAYLKDVKGMRPGNIEEQMNRTRSNLFNQMNPLESLNMVQRERKGRRTVVLATELGLIFGKAFSGQE